MHRKKYKSLLLCAVLTTAMTLTACGSTGSTNKVTLSDTTLTGTVESVDGDTITLTLGGSGGGGEMPEGEAPSGEAVEGETSEEQSAGESAEDSAEESTGESTENSETQTPPEMPEGESTEGGEAPSGEAPSGEAPSGGGQGGMAGGMGGGMSGTVELVIKDTSVIEADGDESGLDAIEEGDSITVTLDENGNIESITVGGTQQGAANMSSGVDSYDAVQEYTSDEEVSGETFSSTGTDENAVHVYKGASVSLDDVEISRDSDDSTGGDNSSFYGVGAALLTSEGETYISGSEITTDAAGGAGLFAYNEGTIYAADTTIVTNQDTSGGIHAAGGGTFYAWNLDVETSGESSAAIRSDRGGGTMVVDGGSYVSNGTGSPAVYCTADISINEATLTSTGSEAVCIEGLNALRLYDCDLTGAMKDDEQNDCTWNLIVYQSMSGDSEIGNSDLEIVGGEITAENGGLIYTTNTEATMLLSDVDITYASDSEFFLRCTGNDNARGWGTAGANGSQCSFTADSQEMEGDVIYDSISTLDFYMQNGSTLTGAFVDDETYAGDGGDGYCNVAISEDSTWTVTGDSQITTLSNEGKIQDTDGKSVTIKGTDGTVYVEGDSDYTITVEEYNTSADFSEASVATSFDDYAVAKPDNL